ncbi:MAG: lipopolysaccharide biosynthesis protein, partial [Chitinophagaceae bacterium]
MELLDFLKTLKRHKLILIFVPALTVLVSYFLVRNMPDKYVSQTRIATGIVDHSQKLLTNNSYHGDSRVNEEFSNITQMIQLNKIIDQVSYHLILSDLKSDQPFHKGAAADNMTPADKAALATYIEGKLQRNEELNLSTEKDKQIYYLLQEKKYDHETIKSQLKAYRLNNSDFIELEYESDQPNLSAFVLNTLSTEFVEYYSNVVTENKRKAVVYLDSTLRTKQATLLGHMENLKNYKINNKVLNMEEQARNYYARIADVATRRGIAAKDVAAYSAALGDINSRFSPGKRQYMESNVSGVNQDIVRLKDEISALNDAYIQNDFDPKYKARMDSLQSKLTASIYDQNDRYATNPLAAKENLVNQKLNLEVSRDLAKNSLSSLDNELGSLNSGLQQMVPSMATIEALEANVEVANKEYQDILQKY